MNQSSSTAISQTPQPAGQKPAAEETAKASSIFNPWFAFAAIPAFKEVQTHWMNPYTGVIRDAWNYTVDAMQRTVLFWYVLRQRSEQYYQHKAMPVPHVLSFEAELVLDARTLERPANYLLMRIVPPAGKAIDAQKRPLT